MSHFVARHDPAHCLAPGLFQSLKRGDRNVHPLHVVYVFNERERLEFHGPYQLGADDLRTLVGLVALASNHQNSAYLVAAHPKTDTGTLMRQRLLIEGDARREQVLAVRTTFYELARTVGYRGFGGYTVGLLRDSLERLAMVTVVLQIDKRRYKSQLIGQYMSDTDTGDIIAGINWRITQAILQERPFTTLSLREMTALHRDAAVILWQRLSGWIDPGETRTVSLPTLVGYVYGEGEETADRRTRWKRRREIRLALDTLCAIGWRVEPVTHERDPVFAVTRQPLSHSHTTNSGLTVDT